MKNIVDAIEFRDKRFVYYFYVEKNSFKDAVKLVEIDFTQYLKEADMKDVFEHDEESYSYLLDKKILKDMLQ
jgi:hypothetical protein